LYEYETWSLTLRAEHRLRVFEKRVLRRIGGWRKLHNEDSYSVYSSLVIIRMIKPGRMRWVGYVAHTGRREMHIGVWWGSQKEEATSKAWTWVGE
jgi:hypothetical protein